ncbi:MAG: extracellular solute-binding protein [Spirochaetes bacterium]|nr:extracellular solute-binding protein [Spirochaetota bacterium]
MKKKIRWFLICCCTLLLVVSVAVLVYAKGGKAKEEEEVAPRVFATEEEMWKQFSGLELNFLTEDTPAAGAILELLPQFKEKTGIKVNVTRTNISDLVTKLMLDLGSGSSNIHIIYSARWQIPPGRSDILVDLRKFENDPGLPSANFDDFFKKHFITTSHFVDKDRIIGVPHDASTMIWFYRTDIFKKYKSKFKSDRGYDWTPGASINWDQYKEIAEWITENVDEVKYGAGHMAKQWNSLYCDFSNVFWSFGARGFENPETESWGVVFPGKSMWGSSEGIAAAAYYKDLIENYAHPSSVAWDWSDLAEAMAKGDEIAMSFNWHDFIITFQDPERSRIVDKVQAAIMPSGPAGSRNYYSGAALAINGVISEKYQRAAWLFLVWQASMPVQKEIFKMGSTPVRKSAYEDPEVKKWMKTGEYPGAIIAPTMFEAWSDENLEYVEGRFPQFVETLIVQYTELSKMLQDLQTPEETMKIIDEKVNEITGYTALIEAAGQ